MDKHMSREQLLELEEVKRGLLVQAYRMKQECPAYVAGGTGIRDVCVDYGRGEGNHGQNTKECRSLNKIEKKTAPSPDGAFYIKELPLKYKRTIINTSVNFGESNTIKKDWSVS